jgi:DNA-binding beta-propeller fold protein YncE
VFDPVTGLFLSIFVPLGFGPGVPANLSNPSGLRFGADGNLYVVDTTNSVVDRFNGTTGTFIDVFGDTGLLGQPIDLAFGPDGNLYVTDSNGVQRFDGSTGKYMGAFVGNTGIINAQYLAFSATTAVPEPSTMGLMVLGALIVLARWRGASGK